MPEKKKTAAAAPAVEAPAAEAKETKETKTRKSAKASARRGRPPACTGAVRGVQRQAVQRDRYH